VPLRADISEIDHLPLRGWVYVFSKETQTKQKSDSFSGTRIVGTFHQILPKSFRSA